MKRRARGSGTIIETGGGTFAIRYGPRGRQSFESGFRSKTEAEARLVVLRSEAMNRRLGAASDPKQTPTLSVLAAPWLERRKETHSAGLEDGSRWRKHLDPYFGHLRPDQVDRARLRAFIETKRAELAPGTLRVCVSTLSSLYEDLLERHLASTNPARHLPKSILRLLRSDHDPKTVPFLERLEDVRRVFLALDGLEPGIAVAFAIGALGGLRTSEVFKLRWSSVDLDARQLVVREGGSRKGTTKDRDPRVVPIQDALHPVLKAWRLRTGGEGLVVPPLRSDGLRVDKHTPGIYLRLALAETKLARPELGWYESTRHTFASHWAMSGRPLRELQKILGHSSIVMTERYAHLAPNYWAEGVRGALPVDLSASGAKVSKLPATAVPRRSAPSARRKT